MTIAYLGLGSNVGDKEEFLRAAVDALDGHVCLRVRETSPIYWTAPQYVEDQDWFLNAVIAVETWLEPEALLATIKDLEFTLGRRPRQRYGPREIDIDLLLYGDRTVDTPDLVVPHPRIAERTFVLRPLADIAPDIEVNDAGETAAALLDALNRKESETRRRRAKRRDDDDSVDEVINPQKYPGVDVETAGKGRDDSGRGCSCDSGCDTRRDSGCGSGSGCGARGDASDASRDDDERAPIAGLELYPVDPLRPRTGIWHERVTCGPEQTERVGALLASGCSGGEVFALCGDLGAGKTCLSRGFARGLAIDQPIQSPTFTLCRTYTEGRLALYHWDFYRLGDSEEAESAGFDDAVADAEGVVLVEWADKFPNLWTFPYVKIWITTVDDESRALAIRFPEPAFPGPAEGLMFGGGGGGGTGET